MSVTNKIVVWGSNPNQYDSGNPYQPDANGNEKGFTPGTLNYALYLNKALRNASIVPHALAQMLTHSPVNGNLDIDFDINPGDIPTFDANFRSAFDAYVKSTIKVDNATHADTADACTGNSATASKLQTVVTIGGVSFDGSSSINLPGVNTAGNQNTSGNAATATKATGDQSGNNIKSTYGASIIATDATPTSNASISLKNKNGSILNTASFNKVSRAFNADNATNATWANYANGLSGYQSQNTWTKIELEDGTGEIAWNKFAVYQFQVRLSDGLNNRRIIDVGFIQMLLDTNDTQYVQFSNSFPQAGYTGGTSDTEILALKFTRNGSGNGISLEVVYFSNGNALSWNYPKEIYYRVIQVAN